MGDTATTHNGYVVLEPSGPTAGAQVGCMAVLGAVLLLLGAGIVSVFFINPAGKGDPSVLLVVGGAFALVGLVLLWGAVRGVRGLRIPPPEVAIDAGVRLVPGAVVKIRVRQPGPINIESLILKASCGRRYMRRVRPRSTSTVPDTEILWEKRLVEVLDERVPAGGVLEREAVLTLPADARPTGPALPDGDIRWQLEVSDEAGFMRATHRAFDIRVEGVPADAGDETRAATGGAGRLGPESAAGGSTLPREMPDTRGGRGAPDRERKEAGTGPRVGVGCVAIGAGFLLCGTFFLWMFFSGAAFQGRGNPYMALVGGVLFAGVGLAALIAAAVALLPSPRKKKG